MDSVHSELVELGGASFLMGTEDADGFPADREGPVREVFVEPFLIDPLAVTNEQFAEFVAATGYVTRAERFGWSFVFAGLLPDEFPDTRAAAQAQWWRQVHGADWRRPEGPGILRRRAGAPPGGPRVLDRRARVLPLGRASAFPPRRSGSTRPAAGSSSAAFRGETSSRRAASIAATSGRAPSPPTTRSTTAGSAPRR